MYRHKAWELLVLIVVFGFVIKAILDFITPLIPYIAIGLLLIAVGYFVVLRRRTW